MVTVERIPVKTIQSEVKHQLINVIDSLPLEKMQQLLAFAAFLRQRSEVISHTPQENLLAQENLDEWEAAIQCAETYWLNLPESARQPYTGQVVAIANDQIVDSDPQLRTLKRRVRKQFPQQPILYIEADAKVLPPLVIRSPKLG